MSRSLILIIFIVVATAALTLGIVLDDELIYLLHKAHKS